MRKKRKEGIIFVLKVKRQYVSISEEDICSGSILNKHNSVRILSPHCTCHESRDVPKSS